MKRAFRSGSDADRIARLAEANGWEAIQLKHGKLRQKLFAAPGGEEFRRVLDEELSDFQFQALVSANRPDLTRSVLAEKSTKLKGFLKKLSDADLQKAFLNLGGHDLECLVEALSRAKHDPKRPTLIVAYTIKGLGLKCQAMSGNHSTLPEEDELAEMGVSLEVKEDAPFADFEDSSPEGKFLSKRRTPLVQGIQEIISQVAARRKKYAEIAREIEWPKDFDITAIKFNPVAHTQWMWGQIAAKLDRLARGQNSPKEKDGKFTANEEAWKPLAPLFLTMAPDVGSSTNTSPNMNAWKCSTGRSSKKTSEATHDTKDQKAL